MKNIIRIHLPYLIKEIFDKVVHMNEFGDYYYETILIFYWRKLDLFGKRLEFTTEEEIDSINGEIIVRIPISTYGDSAGTHTIIKEWLREDIEGELYKALVNQSLEPMFINHIQVFGYNFDECKCTYSVVISNEEDVNNFLYHHENSYDYLANFDNIYILTEKEAKMY